MHTASTRRAILAGAAAAPPLSLPAIADEDDPIFAAIEAHRAAFIPEMRAARFAGSLRTGTKEFAAAHSAWDELGESLFAKEETLLNTVPETTAGVFALLSYARDLHTEVIYLPEDPDQWAVSAESLGEGYGDERFVHRHNGEMIEMPFPCWIVVNALTALQHRVLQS